MANPKISAGMSSLDLAYAYRKDGLIDEALKLGLAAMSADARNLDAAMLVALILTDSGRGLLAGEVCTRLVEGYSRRGNLPLAVVCALVAGKAGESTGDLLDKIAESYSRDSKRIAAVSPAPPPLPAPVEVPSIIERMNGETLLAQAEETFNTFLGMEDPHPAFGKLPSLPLFSQLDQRSLRELLGAFELFEGVDGDTIVEQGAEGDKMYVVARGALEVSRGAGGEKVVLAGLGPGHIFGEMSLLAEAPRAATVTAVEPVQLLVIAKSKLETIAEKAPELAAELAVFCRRRMVDNLMKHGILKAVGAEERDLLVERFEARAFERGDTLLAADAEADALYVIASGEVQVVGTDDDGEPMVIARLGVGNVVGEIGLVLRRKTTAAVVATMTTVAMALTRESFEASIATHPTLLAELYRLATKRDDELKSLKQSDAIDASDLVML